MGRSALPRLFVFGSALIAVAVRSGLSNMSTTTELHKVSKERDLFAQALWEYDQAIEAVLEASVAGQPEAFMDRYHDLDELRGRVWATYNAVSDELKKRSKQSSNGRTISYRSFGDGDDIRHGSFVRRIDGDGAVIVHDFQTNEDVIVIDDHVLDWGCEKGDDDA